MPLELTEAELKEYKELFSFFDKDDDGKISTQEFITAVHSLGIDPTEAELHDMIKEVDADKSGCVDFTEFCTAIYHKIREAVTSNEIYEAFKVFDKDGDGYIQASDLKVIMNDLGEKLPDTDINEMIQEADLNNDGRIDFNEFIELMNSGI